MAITTIDDRGSLVSDPLRQFRFKVDFIQKAPFDKRITTNTAGGFTGGFTSVSGLSIITQPIMYREGGYNTTMHKVPGMTSFPDVTLSRGVLYGNDQSITWMRGMFAAVAGEGLNVATNGKTTNATSQFRCDVKIMVMDHPNADATKNSPRMAFLLRNAFITSLDFGALDAGNNQIMTETMTLTHEGLSALFVDANGKALDTKYNPSHQF